jgi:photosystem II stability/assembly factor-like uncharacterized protein
MKRILFLLILALWVGNSWAQLNVWRWQNPLPEGDYLYSVQMIDLNTIVACGAQGYFVHSADGGASWDLENNVLKFTGGWNCVNFANPNFGMCCGDSGKAIKTTDGGKTWKFMPTGVTVKLNSIVLIDTNIALMVMLGGGILKTTDGGVSWHGILSEGVATLYSIRKLRPDFLYVTGYGGTVMNSRDSGETWTPIKMPNGNTYYSACYTDERTATVIGENAIVFHTADGGKTWKQLLLDSVSITANLNSIDGIDPNILTIVGDYGTVLYTTNGGLNWNRFYLGTNEHIKSVSYFDKLHATAVGRDGVILMTSDGGKTWVFVPQTPEVSTLYSVAFPKGDTSIGIGVGENGTIKRTTNGGALWEAIKPFTRKALRGVAFADMNTAFAVGDTGFIIKTTDAGLTWTQLTSNSRQNLNAVSFATPNDGIAVGDSNAVLKTTTAGLYWTHEFISPPSKPPYLAPWDFFGSVSYPDKMHAFATGWHIYYLSSDGGITWTYKMIDPRDTMVRPRVPDNVIGVWPVTKCNALSFADSIHGAMSVLELDEKTDDYLDSGKIVYTTDGFEDWHWLATKNLPGIYLNLHFYDRLRVTAVGLGGAIAHSTDGGVNWVTQESHTVNNLFGICFGTPEAGNAVGLRGVIIRRTTDEKPLSDVRTTVAANSQLIIEGNYPNPFSQLTTITYLLPEPGPADLRIFSADGKEVSSKLFEYETEGIHRITFDGSGLSAGTYLLRITSGSLAAEGKIIIER